MARDNDIKLKSYYEFMFTKFHSRITPYSQVLLNFTHRWEWKFPELHTVASRCKILHCFIRFVMVPHSGIHLDMKDVTYTVGLPTCMSA
jgi:hypothetical protein